MHTAIRALSGSVSTTAQVQTLLTLLSLSSTEKVELFAHQVAENQASMVVVARGKFAGIGPCDVVYDALTLSVTEPARYAEVRELLDLAVASKKCYFSQTLAPPTGHLSAGEALAQLRALDAGQLMSHQSRPAFFALLSTVREADIADVNRPG